MVIVQAKTKLLCITRPYLYVKLLVSALIVRVADLYSLHLPQMEGLIGSSPATDNGSLFDK